METRDWNRIKELFSRSLERGPEERLDFLRRVSTDDPWLAGELESLLAVNRSSGREGLPAAHKAAAVRHPTPLTFDADIGPYRIVKAIEQGATGTVYLAQRLDDGSGAHVLIKMIRPDSLDRELSASIDQHCCLLAALDHPNLVRVLDGGTIEAGFPYIVMEHFSGEALDRYCDRRELSIRERLQLFVKICSAVNYLHRRSILHRDLRPANILVKEDGTPRLVGVGIPSLPGPRSAWPAHKVVPPKTAGRESTSPEKASGKEASVASDVHALGALLYELLCGHGPAGPGSMRIAGAEGRPQEHLKSPSAMLTHLVVLEVKNTSLLVTPERVCRSRGCGLQELRSQIRGNLDSIALRALRKEPAQRYESAAKLAEDIERYLADYPVSSAPARLFSRVRSLLPL